MNRKILLSGLGAGILSTYIMDLGNRLLSIPGWVNKSDPRHLGRVSDQWMHGSFQNNLFKLEPVANEYLYGVLTHYTIGIILATCFVYLSHRLWNGIRWTWQPLAFGMATCVFAWFLLFPSIGFGLFGMNAPPQAHLFRGSLINHGCYALGLALAAFILARFDVYARKDEGEQAGTLMSLSFAQAIASAAMAGTFMMGSLLLVELSGEKSGWAGVPTALILITSSLIVYPMANWKDKKGYKAVLSLAFSLGAFGGALAAAGALLQSRAFLMLGFIFVGCANGSILLSRFAAAEIVAPNRRGKSMSLVITGATLGAVGGPILAHAAESLGSNIGAPKAFLPFLTVIAVYLMGLIFIRPVIRAEHKPAAGSAPAAAPVPSPRSHLFYAGGSMLFGQVAMVFLMAVTPVHMHHHHHDTGSISMVLTVHFLGMYGMSFVSGWLADKVGRVPVINIGSVLLVSACIAGMFSASMPWVLGSLFLLGLGWNFVFISGSVLLSDSLKGRNRGRIQGISDGLVSLSSAGASLSSGLLLASLGFTRIAWIGMALAAVPLLLLPLMRRGRGGDSPGLEATAPAARNAVSTRA